MIPATVRSTTPAGDVIIVGDDGVSLTVAAALPNGDFQVAIIPHTWEVTTLSTLKAGTKVNLEIDMLARYVARMIGADAPEGK
jgi:riboflavin synthase